MSHSVRRHLHIRIASYDATIRAWIPGYEAMLERAALAVASTSPASVLDLGAGTGGLSAAILAHPRVGTVELLDADHEMLAQARHRLKAHEGRTRFTLGSFTDPLPPRDAVAASLALHHIPTLEERTRLFQRVFEALPSGGVFVNADVMMPTGGAGREAAFAAWAAWMARSGIDGERARAHFAEWAEEDTYFPVEEELRALGAVGFDAACVWRDEPSTVVVARRP